MSPSSARSAVRRLMYLGGKQPTTFCHIHYKLQVKSRSDFNENDKDEKKKNPVPLRGGGHTTRRYREREREEYESVERGAILSCYRPNREILWTNQQTFISDVFLSWHVFLVSVYMTDSFLQEKSLYSLNVLLPNKILVIVLVVIEFWPGLYSHICGVVFTMFL